MAKPSSELRQHFGHQVSDLESEEFLGWLALVDAEVRRVAPGHDLMDFTDPGWVEVWRTEASCQEACLTLQAVDLCFEDFVDFHKQPDGGRYVD